MIVADASVVVTALGDDGERGARARERLLPERVLAPHLIDVEVVAAWRRMVRVGDLDRDRAALARSDLFDLPLIRAAHGPLLERAWELRENLTIYAAMYVALAELMDATLLTLDARLARAPGIRCEVEVLA